MDFSKMNWDEIPIQVGPLDRISRNFVFGELYHSHLGIDNHFHDIGALRAAVYLARKVLQPIRDKFGPFTPNSVYRCQDLERALKKKPPTWTSQSQHTRGEAADIEVPGVDNLELARWIEFNLTFDQLILELYDPHVEGSGWVHVSHCGGRAVSGRGRPPRLRGEVLSYRRASATSRSYTYVKGL